VAKSREIEHRFESVEGQLHLYQRISRYHGRNIPIRDALNGIVTTVAGFMQSDSCLLYLISGDRLVLCAAAGGNPAAVGEVMLRLDEGLTGWVARERRVLAISREAYNDPRFKFFRDLPEDTFEAFLSAPVIVRNHVIGVINLQHRQPHSHTGGELEMVTTVGEQIGALVAVASIEAGLLGRAAHADLVLGGGALAERT